MGIVSFPFLLNLFALRTLLLTLLLFSFLCGTHAQAQSSYLERLYYLCKVWGHAKYYHTEIAAGNVNWDEALLQAVDSVKNSTTDAAFNGALLEMLNAAGTMGSPFGTLPTVPDSMNNNWDQDWIHDAILSPQVSAILDTITTRFRPQDHVLLDRAFTNGNPTFDEDDSLHNWALFPDENQRLLSLFRHWNIIHYFFPYKQIMDQHWDSTLVHFIPRIVNATDGLEFHIAFRQYTAKIDDSHAFIYSFILNEWYGFYAPPFLARYIEDEVVITMVSPSVTTIHVGDILETIDGLDVDVLMDSLLNYVHGSNDEWKRYRAIDMMLRGPQGNFSLSVTDSTGNTVTALLERNSANQTQLNNILKAAPSWEIDSTSTTCSIGLVNMYTLETGEIPDMFEEFKDVDAIVFDVRAYPNGTLWTLVNYLYSSPVHLASFAVPDITYPGTFYWNDVQIGTGTNDPYDGKMAILFDERTLSQAEYTCMGLERYPGAIKVGSTTAAADGNVSRMYLPGKITALATFLGTYYPDHSPTQRVGIVPDYKIRPTIEGIRAGRDEVLEHAIAKLGCETIGITEHAAQGRSILYPNPTSTLLHLNTTSDRISYRVMDTHGRTLLESTMRATPEDIDISLLDNGIYLIELSDGKQTWVERVIKQ